MDIMKKTLKAQELECELRADEKLCEVCHGERVQWFERWIHNIHDPHDGVLIEYQDECRECEGLGFVSMFHVEHHVQRSLDAKD